MRIATSLPITRDPAVALAALRRGGLVGIPTETVYGLAADATSEASIERVYEVKQRPRGHPLILHLGDRSWLEDWAVLVPTAAALATAFWPGPLTLLLGCTHRVLRSVTGGRDTVAVRVPAHPVTLGVLGAFGRPLVAPSANLYGSVSPTTAAHVADDLGGRLDPSRDLVLDGGPTTFGVESTIVDCTTTVPQILRPGAVAAEEIAGIIGEVAVASGPARAPGMLPSHYAPRADVELADDVVAGRRRVDELTADGRVAVVLHDPDVTNLARTLYAKLRDADAAGADVVVAVLPASDGVGAAIRDRLTRAASRRR